MSDRDDACDSVRAPDLPSLTKSDRSFIWGDNTRCMICPVSVVLLSPLANRFLTRGNLAPSTARVGTKVRREPAQPSRPRKPQLCLSGPRRAADAPLRLPIAQIR